MRRKKTNNAGPGRRCAARAVRAKGRGTTGTRSIGSVRQVMHRLGEGGGGAGTTRHGHGRSPETRDPRDASSSSATDLSMGTQSACTPPPPVTFRRVVVSLRGPGQSPGLPFACCVGSLRSVGRCGRCSCWCRFRVRGAQSLVCRGCAGCGGMCRLCVSGAQ